MVIGEMIVGARGISKTILRISLLLHHALAMIGTLWTTTGIRVMTEVAVEIVIAVTVVIEIVGVIVIGIVIVIEIGIVETIVIGIVTVPLSLTTVESSKTKTREVDL